MYKVLDVIQRKKSKGVISVEPGKSGHPHQHVDAVAQFFNQESTSSFWKTKYFESAGMMNEAFKVAFFIY